MDNDELRHRVTAGHAAIAAPPELTHCREGSRSASLAHNRKIPFVAVLAAFAALKGRGALMHIRTQLISLWLAVFFGVILVIAFPGVPRILPADVTADSGQ